MTTKRPFSSPIDLLKKVTSTRRPEDAIRGLVSDLRGRVAAVKGPVRGVTFPPYDPRPFAELLGAVEVRGANMDVAGRIVFDDEDLIVEFSRESSAPNRRRFTIAHEVGHLAIWEAERRLVPAAKPRRARSQVVERLCDGIAAELLAPHDEIVQTWRAFRAWPAPEKRGSDRLKFIEELAKKFRISIQMAAIRFVETCGPRIGVGLLDTEKECFVWCYQVPDRASLLEFLLARYKEYLAKHPNSVKPEEELFCGAESYPLLSKESGSVPAEWKTLGSAVNLCLVVAKPRMFLHKRDRGKQRR